MSGLAGIVWTDGRPADIESLQPALHLMSALGPDRVTSWSEDSLALAHLTLHATPEAHYEQWPLRNDRGDILIADARLDNRADLIHTLRLESHSDLPITDAELILAAHERWGDEAPTHLLGDFAYALWSGAARTLQLVRSPFGLKILYYAVEPTRILFASTLRGVLALTPRNVPNLPWVASFLTWEMEYLRDQTAFTHIRKVPPAHLVSFRLDPVRERGKQFWALAPTDSFSGWNDDDWAEGFRERFEEAVAARLRSSAPIAVTVSGGLDSSSIALVAHRLMVEEARIPSLPIHSYTQRMPKWPDTDESTFQEAVFERLPGFEKTVLSVERAWSWEIVERWHHRMSTPSNYPNAFMFHSMFQQTQEHGCRVKLSGIGGDIVTGGEDYGIPQAFDSLAWDEKAREFPFFAPGGRRKAVRFARRWVRDRFPAQMVRAWQRQRDPQLFTPLAEAAAARQKQECLTDGSPLQQFVYEVLFGAAGVQPIEQRAEIMAMHGLELRVPFYDRRLVELAFHQPLHLRFHRGQTRLLLKRALARDLPPLLLQRASKADFTRFTAYSISPEDHARAVHLAPESLLRSQGWIDSERWPQWSAHPERPSQTVTIHRVAHLNQWLNDALES